MNKTYTVYGSAMISKGNMKQRILIQKLPWNDAIRLRDLLNEIRPDKHFGAEVFCIQLEKEISHEK